jgi:hypothetical protein
MNYWEGPARWINTILLVIVGFIGFDTLFELLNANTDNVIVGFTESVAGWFLAPFQGMFPEQDYLLTALIAILGYSLLAGVALAVTRSIQASRQSQAPRSVEPRAPQRPARPGSSPQSPGPERPYDDRTRQL